MTKGALCSPCSAVGSKDALGSSKRSMPTLGSEVSDRINVRDLQECQWKGWQDLPRYLQSNSLHLPPRDGAGIIRLHSTHSPYTAVIYWPTEKRGSSLRKSWIVILDRPVQISIKACRESVDELLSPTKPRSFENLFLVLGMAWIPETDVVFKLRGQYIRYARNEVL